MKNVLVVSTGNSCRGQMAHGYLHHFAKDKAMIYSAGIESHDINPKAIAIMKLDGVDISSYSSNVIAAYENIDFDYVITVCDDAKENYPDFLNTTSQQIHQNFIDPSKITGSEAHIFSAFKKTREQIKMFCEEFVNTTL
jgi:arsenate reductase